jgi:photosystem II stability/assembly factor-like uncharacterized protein
MTSASRTRSGRGKCWVRLAALPALGVLSALLALSPGGRGDEASEHPQKARPVRVRSLQGVEDGDSPQVLFAAMQQLNRMRAQAGLQAKVAGLPVGVQVDAKDLAVKAGGLTPGGWKWLGPGNIGGPTLALLAHPKDANVLYAGSTHGLWVTTNGGQRWGAVSELLSGFAVSSLAVDPTNPAVIYAGTGTGQDTRGWPGIGILKTEDSGAVWKSLSSTQRREFFWLNRLAVSADGKVLLAATPLGIQRSTNGGKSWMLAGGPGEEPIQDLRFHPTAPERCIAGGWRGVAFYSTDGGARWARARGLPSLTGKNQGRVELTYALGSPDVVYASVDIEGGRLYRSADGGQNFTRIDHEQKPLGQYGSLSNCLWAGDPTRPDLVVVGGDNLWRSTDGGKTLECISEWDKVEAPQIRLFFNAAAADARFNGTSNRAVHFGTGGGIYRAEDITTVNPTEGWQSLNTNYGAVEIVAVAGNPESGTIVAGCSNHGTMRYTREGGPEKWTRMVWGNGGVCAADPRDSRCYYGESWCLQLLRSLDGGETSQWIFEGIADAKDPKSANFTAPFVLDPNDPKVLLAGGKSLWRCPDAKADKPAWTAIKPSMGQLVNAIAVAKGSSDTIWVGHNDGSLFGTANGTADSPTWKRLDEARRLPRRYCSRIVFDPGDPKRAFATFGGYEQNNVWRTEDGGGTWTPIPIRAAGTQPLRAPVNDLAIHPANPKCLYAATQVGVFASEDGGRLWSPTNEGPTSCAVTQFFWMDKTLLAATYGRGLFQIDLGSVRPARE